MLTLFKVSLFIALQSFIFCQAERPFIEIQYFNDNEYLGWSDGTFAQSCEEYRYPPRFHYYSGNAGSGVYRIQTNNYQFNVYCTMDEEINGYTRIFQRFQEDPVRVDFNQSWESYKFGFGDPIDSNFYSKWDSQYWLGLEHLLDICTDEATLRVHIEGEMNQEIVLGNTIYNHFAIADEANDYITQGMYFAQEGNSCIIFKNYQLLKVPDLLSPSFGYPFSTFDRNHISCEEIDGGWWYSTCQEPHLTDKLIGKMPDFNIHYASVDVRSPSIYNINYQQRLFKPNPRCVFHHSGEDRQNCEECDSEEQFLDGPHCVESYECPVVALPRELSGTINICAEACPPDHEPNENLICVPISHHHIMNNDAMQPMDNNTMQPMEMHPYEIWQPRNPYQMRLDAIDHFKMNLEHNLENEFQYMKEMINNEIQYMKDQLIYENEQQNQFYNGSMLQKQKLLSKKKKK